MEVGRCWRAESGEAASGRGGEGRGGGLCCLLFVDTFVWVCVVIELSFLT